MSLLTPKVQPGQFPQSFHYQPDPNDMVLQFTSGASGDVPAALTYSNGIEGVVHDAAGLYTVTLDSIWTALFSADGSINLANATFATNVALGVKVFAWDLPNRTVKFATYQLGTGAATDMASGDVLTLFLDFGWQSKNTPGIGL